MPLGPNDDIELITSFFGSRSWRTLKSLKQCPVHWNHWSNAQCQDLNQQLAGLFQTLLKEQHKKTSSPHKMVTCWVYREYEDLIIHHYCKKKSHPICQSANIWWYSYKWDLRVCILVEKGKHIKTRKIILNIVFFIMDKIFLRGKIFFEYLKSCWHSCRISFSTNKFQ